MRYDILGEATTNQIILKFYPLNDDVKQQITRLGYKALLELTLKVSENNKNSRIPLFPNHLIILTNYRKLKNGRALLNSLKENGQIYNLSRIGLRFLRTIQITF